MDGLRESHSVQPSSQFLQHVSIVSESSCYRLVAQQCNFAAALPQQYSFRLVFGTDTELVYHMILLYQFYRSDWGHISIRNLDRAKESRCEFPRLSPLREPVHPSQITFLPFVEFVHLCAFQRRKVPQGVFLYSAPAGVASSSIAKTFESSLAS